LVGEFGYKICFFPVNGLAEFEVDSFIVDDDMTLFFPKNIQKRKIIFKKKSCISHGDAKNEKKKKEKHEAEEEQRKRREEENCEHFSCCAT
jgi:hypothetical protein